MPDMSYNTIDGQPPMSLVGGGNNVQMPQQQTPVMPSPQAPQMATITVPSHILQDPAVQASVQAAQAKYQQQAAAMPKATDISMGDSRTQAMINNIQAMKNSGVMAPLGSMQNHPILGGIANAMMGFGQGITHQPFLTDFNAQQQARNQQLAEQARYGQLTPEQQIMMGFRQQSLDLAKDRLANTQSNQGQNQWSGLVNKVNGMTASSRSGLGMAAGGNVFIDRALKTLNDPNIKLTPQLMNGVIEDLTRQYSGGVPTDQGMNGQTYDTLNNRIAAFKQLITSSPQEINTPEIKQQLINTFGDIKDINNQVIKNNLDTIEGAQGSLISKHPKEWAALRAGLEKNNQVGSQTQGVATPTGTVSQQVTQANAMPFQVGQQYNGHTITSVKVKGQS